jgi:hypothetical protein
MKNIESELPALSPKEMLFEIRGQHFLIRTGHVGLFLQSQMLPHYSEVWDSWQVAIRALSFGTPQIATNSIAEKEQLEFFFMELRHGDPSLVFSKYNFLVSSRLADPDFQQAVAKTLLERQIPNNALPSLACYLVGSWLHSFFWGLSNLDRILLLHRIYGVTDLINIKTLKRAVSALRLKAWSHFRQTYPEPPFRVQLFREGQQERCRISICPRGHFET